jgi:hypothetical protein
MFLRSTLFLISLGCVDKASLYDKDDGSSGADSSSSDSAIDSGGTTSIDSDGDGYDASEDCNDSDAAIYPGALEICDGVDNDCDEATSESGQVQWFDDDGSTENLSESFLAGTPAVPAQWLANRGGELHICSVDIYAQLEVRASVTLRGHGETPPSLSAAEQGSVISIQGIGLDVHIEDLIIKEGQGDFTSVLAPEVTTAGGGIGCAGPNQLSLTGVTLLRNEAQWGGGMFIEECTLTASDTSLRLNEGAVTGGGLLLYEASASFQDSVFIQNTSELGSAGMVSAGAEDMQATLVLDNTVVEANEGAVGGAYLSYAKLECHGSSETRSGFLRNASTGAFNAGAVFLAQGSELVSQACDWGDEGSTEDNTPVDLNTTSTNYGDDASFVQSVEATR